MPVHVNTVEINIDHISFVYFIAFLKSQCFPSTYFTVNPKHAHKKPHRHTFDGLSIYGNISISNIVYTQMVSIPISFWLYKKVATGKPDVVMHTHLF